MQPTPLPTSTPNKLITQKPTASSRSVCLATFTTGCLDNSNAECCSGICGIDRFNVDHCICKASTTGDDGECKNPGQEDPVCCSNYCGSSGNCECAPQSATCIPNFGAENVSVQQCCGDLTCSELGVCVSPTARPTSFPTPDVTSSPTTSGCTPLSACSGSSGSVGIGGCLGGSSCIGKSGNVGAGSCQGIDSCSLSLGDIGEYSCFGPSSCVENAGYISGGSCIGSSACAYNDAITNSRRELFSLSYYNDTTVGSFSCIGQNSCANNTESVGENSCQGSEACYKNSGTIGSNSCNGYRACYQNNRTIGHNQCNGSYSCNLPSPTNSPTSQPTSMPTPLPTIRPSSPISTSSTPSSVGSDAPSVSLLPSQMPSNLPSESSAPTMIPSSSPTMSSPPSIALSSRPSTSFGPSSVGSDAPSVSSVPSQMPSDLPSESSAQTVIPSLSPSIALSSQPSTSFGPSSVGSDDPSVSLLPSQMPSDLPSESSAPTMIPSLSPTMSSPPSIALSSRPSTSSGPTSVGSDAPSVSLMPSQMPSDLPSESRAPTMIPSSSPTMSSSPSIALSSRPSTSSGPSSVGSDAPSVSLLPSQMPSDLPSESLSPSIAQSAEPSFLPSQMPSDLPSESKQPSLIPSPRPSLSPSFSSEPSSLPSATQPPSRSSQPSNKPSAQPSLSPSESLEPSSLPSSSPTQPKPQVEVAISAAMFLDNITVPEDSVELDAFVISLETALEVTVSDSLQSDQRLLGVEITSIGERSIDTTSNGFIDDNETFTRRIRTLVAGTVEIDYTMHVEELCEYSDCSDGESTVNLLAANVTAAVTSQINGNNFTETLTKVATSNGVSSLSTVSIQRVEAKNFGSPVVVVVLPKPTPPPTLEPSLLPSESGAPSTVEQKTPRNLTPKPTPQTSSQPPQQMVRRNLAARINNIFTLENGLDKPHDPGSLRKILEGTFSDAEGTQDVFTKHHSRSLRVSNSTMREDYFDDLPAFVTLDTSDPFKCKCVECDEDEVCGGLWKGAKYLGTPNGDLSAKKIHIVVSHCKNDLDWLEEYTKGFNIASIHVVTKCGDPVRGIPDWATIEALPNIGRCDHTYAYYITTVLPQKIQEGEEDDSLVVFLKDDISQGNFHQSGHWNDFDTMLRLAASDNGFACGVEPGGIEVGPHKLFLSAYHDVETLFDFSIGEYSRNIKGYAVDASEFKSQYETLGSWFNSLGVTEVPSQVVQVCYGGVFAGSVKNILMRDMSVWKAIEKSLSRGNNIQEGHYAERSWGNLISTPLQPFQAEALLAKSDAVYINKSSMHAALLRRPKLFLHIGVKGTSSSELLSESLVAYNAKLKSDGYNVAVHGQYEDGQNGFPNIDRLGSCMWSDMSKKMFPKYMKEATICPENLVPDLQEFMNHTLEESLDLIITNPWLSRRGTAESMSVLMDSSWDISVVVYYRRYFEWITLVFDDWRSELFNHTLTPHDIPYNAFRYIDFIRENCKRLFYGKDVEEDELPTRSLYQSVHLKKKVYMNKFDPTTNVDLEELTDLLDYSYFAAKQYYSQPRFRQDITIVNYHDVRGPEVNFYCHVLHDAHNACKAAIEKENALTANFDRKDDKFVQRNSNIPFNTINAYEDIVIAAYQAKKLVFDDAHPEDKFSSQILLWIGMIHSALEKNDINIADLPVECLYQYEVDRLLNVSLAYERSLLPDFFISKYGGTTLQNEYNNWQFCSVDTPTILGDSQWDFLFGDASNFSLPHELKAYIHIGAPKTGSTSIQNTMMKDKEVLKQDKYFLALHGQEFQEGEDRQYISDNTFVRCDRLPACIWSEEQRNEVIAGSGDKDAGSCPEYVLPTLTEFLSRAIEADSDVVISNEWLNRPSSETGLLNVLDGWDPTIVIYYRRYFDWMVSAHYQWHFDLGSTALEALEGKVRLLDFFRMFCGRLFALNSYNKSDGLADLTDIGEYAYHMWKRYNVVYKKNIKIVNFHDGHIIQSFYCGVLDAPNACNLEQDRRASVGTVKSNTKTSTAFVDLAIGLYFKLRGLRELTSSVTMKTFNKIGDRLNELMMSKGLTEHDLPKECLSNVEKSLLLRVSLEYERILLPDSFASGGEDATSQHFAEMSAADTFCSVDIHEVVANQQWTFLIDELSTTNT